MRKINRLVVHCSATPPSMDIGAAEIRDWHVGGNGWVDIGYHYVIMRDGTIETGRPLEHIGAHIKGYNDKSVGICLVGGVDFDGQPADNFTGKQYAALTSLLSGLKKRFPTAEILGHRDLNKEKVCPCFDVKKWWGEVNV